MNIKKIRGITKLNQSDFAKKYRIPLKTLQNWESDPSKKEYRKCPDYCISILEKVVLMDYPIDA